MWRKSWLPRRVDVSGVEGLCAKFLKCRGFHPLVVKRLKAIEDLLPSLERELEAECAKCDFSVKMLVEAASAKAVREKREKRQWRPLPTAPLI